MVSSQTRCRYLHLHPPRWIAVRLPTDPRRDVYKQCASPSKTRHCVFACRHSMFSSHCFGKFTCSRQDLLCSVLEPDLNFSRILQKVLLIVATRCIGIRFPNVLPVFLGVPQGEHNVMSALQVKTCQHAGQATGGLIVRTVIYFCFTWEFHFDQISHSSQMPAPHQKSRFYLI